MSYEYGYETSNTIDGRLTTKDQISGIAKALGLGASFEASVQYAEATADNYKVRVTSSYDIAAGFNFWICQRQAHLKIYNVPNAVAIFDTQLVISGDMC